MQKAQIVYETKDVWSRRGGGGRSLVVFEGKDHKGNKKSWERLWDGKFSYPLDIHSPRGRTGRGREKKEGSSERAHTISFLSPSSPPFFQPPGPSRTWSN